MPSPRRFPPPWSAEENAESFTVRDATGQALAYVLRCYPAALQAMLSQRAHPVA
jgi:hypothetical protein